MKPKIQIGVVPYLNSKPLVRGHEAFRDQADFHFIPPRRLAELMARDKLDIALVSCVDYLRGGRRILPEVGIVSRGAVNSVLLMGQSPVEEAETVNLDPDSLTSCSLAALWYREQLGRTPRFTRFPLDSAEARACDARLAIGDSALRLLGTEPYQVDLGMVWENWVGHPFVYAVWLVREGVELGKVGQFLKSASSRFEPGFTLLAAEASRDLNLDRDICVKYLAHSLQFSLDEEALRGLEVFLNLAAKHSTWLAATIEGFPPLGVPVPIPLEFHEEPLLADSLDHSTGS
jgi:chorismate dehydratase